MQPIRDLIHVVGHDPDQLWRPHPQLPAGRRAAAAVRARLALCAASVHTLKVLVRVGDRVYTDGGPGTVFSYHPAMHSNCRGKGCLSWAVMQLLLLCTGDLLHGADVPLLLQPQRHDVSLVSLPEQAGEACNGASSPPQAAVDAALQAAQQVPLRQVLKPRYTWCMAEPCLGDFLIVALLLLVLAWRKISSATSSSAVSRTDG